MSSLPHYASGEVVKGFGRGSKQLGIPTANFGPEVIASLPADIQTGIYCGFACVDAGPVYKMVLSIGWNPFFKNERKSMETHIMHKFEEDFYGKTLKVLVVDYIRPERSFESLDELIKAIDQDISEAESRLDDEKFRKMKSEYFPESCT